MGFNRYLQTNAQQINQQLEQILSEFLKQTKKTNTRLRPFALGLINACKGGKRIRGTLVKLGYEIGGGKGADILGIGAAIEILHAAILIHDDIIDKSPTRRGQPSLYTALGGGHYGVSQAISLGDIGLYLPIKIIAETTFLGEYKIAVLKHLSETIINTGWGQIMDIEKDKDMDFVNLFKTAKYTIAAPLQIGAILAGAEEKLLGLLGGFGENLGIAFQIKDDILDQEADSIDETYVKALQYVTQAKALIPMITDNSRFKKLLEQMADYMVERSK